MVQLGTARAAPWRNFEAYVTHTHLSAVAPPVLHRLGLMARTDAEYAAAMERMSVTKVGPVEAGSAVWVLGGE